MRLAGCVTHLLGLVLCLFGAAPGGGEYVFESSIPFILTTAGGGGGVNVTNTAWKLLTEDQLHPVDCIEKSLSENCELNKCANSVGPYHTADENGNFSLDAMLMDGDTKVVGAIGNLKEVRAVSSVARAVMKYTTHTLITGDGATKFAEEMGFPRENLRTEDSERRWEEWKNGSCQPNHRQNVIPDPTESCGPYAPADDTANVKRRAVTVHDDDVDPEDDREGHSDTMGQIIVAETGTIAVGVTTNGLGRKVPGRVADSGIPGAGGYAWSGVGAACTTGQGDLMLRTLPSFETVLRMEDGDSPGVAAAKAIIRLLDVYPHATAILVAGGAQGQFSIACTGDRNITINWRSPDVADATGVRVYCPDSRRITSGGNHVLAGKTYVALALLPVLLLRLI